MGLVMPLLAHPDQRAVSAVYSGARGYGFGRALAETSSPGHRFSAREGRRLGALRCHAHTTRPAVPALVLMTAKWPRAPITVIVGVVRASREPRTATSARSMRWPHRAGGKSRSGPGVRVMQERIDQIHRSREQITVIRVVRRLRGEKQEAVRFGGATTPSPRCPASGADGGHVPVVQPHHQPVERGGAVDRCQPHRVGRHQRWRAGRLPQLPGADPDVGGDGDVRGVDDSPGGGLGRPHPGGTRHRRQCRAAATMPRRPTGSLALPGLGSTIRAEHSV